MIECKGSSVYCSRGGVLASTGIVMFEEHAGEYEDLDKNIQPVVGNDYALAA